MFGFARDGTRCNVHKVTRPHLSNMHWDLVSASGTGSASTWTVVATSPRWAGERISLCNSLVIYGRFVELSGLSFVQLSRLVAFFVWRSADDIGFTVPPITTCVF